MRRTVPLLLACLLVSACGPSPTTSNPTTQATTKPTDPKLYPPCHPGCFPSGTLVLTPTGTREIQTVKAGDTVTIIAADGTTTSGAVEGVFETCNKLLDLTTDAGTIRTTETQPLCRVAGGFVEAGKLQAGDQIWTWANDRRTAATVKGVKMVDGTAAVFNLVVGKDKVFVAGGFLARGKPPGVKE
jgi:hypothetical protein